MTLLRLGTRSERLLWVADNLDQRRTQKTATEQSLAEAKEKAGRRPWGGFGQELQLGNSKAPGIVWCTFPLRSSLSWLLGFVFPNRARLVVAGGGSMRIGSGRQRHLSLLVLRTADSFNDIEQRRNDKNRDRARSRYSSDDCRAHDLTRHRAGT